MFVKLRSITPAWIKRHPLIRPLGISIYAFVMESYQRFTAPVYRRMIPGSSYIDPTVQVIGWRQTQIGQNCVIAQGCWLNVNDRESPDKTLQIGDNCYIGKNNFISVGKSVIIRDYCLTAIGCQFVGSTHVYQDPFLPYIATGVTLKDEIYVGVNCSFGVDVLVVGDVRIGHGSVIGAGAVIRESVPPFSLVVGNPSRIIKRFDFVKKEWVASSAQEGYNGPGEEEYLEILRKNVPAIRKPLAAASKRMGDL